MPRLHARLVPAPHAPAVRDRRVLAFAGIGRPEKLFRSLAEAGAALVGQHAFADHHRYRRREVLSLLSEAAALDALCITTTKDLMRLPEDLRLSITIWPVAVSWGDRAALERVLDCVTIGR
jgi:tetraacyldisaccharide 4'-kinase